MVQTIGRAPSCMPATSGALTTLEHLRAATETVGPAAPVGFFVVMLFRDAWNAKAIRSCTKKKKNTTIEF